MGQINDRVLPKLILFGEEHNVLILPVVQTGLAFLQLLCHAICNFEHANRSDKIRNQLKSTIKKTIQLEKEREEEGGKLTDGSLRLHTKTRENKLFLDFKYFLHNAVVPEHRSSCTLILAGNAFETFRADICIGLFMLSFVL